MRTCTCGGSKFTDILVTPRQLTGPQTPGTASSDVAPHLDCIQGMANKALADAREAARREVLTETAHLIQDSHSLPCPEGHGLLDRGHGAA